MTQTARSDIHEASVKVMEINQVEQAGKTQTDGTAQAVIPSVVVNRLTPNYEPVTGAQVAPGQALEPVYAVGVDGGMSSLASTSLCALSQSSVDCTLPWGSFALLMICFATSPERPAS